MKKLLIVIVVSMLSFTAIAGESKNRLPECNSNEIMPKLLDAFLDAIKNKLIAEEKGYIDYKVLRENIFVMRGLLSFIDLKEVNSYSGKEDENRVCTAKLVFNGQTNEQSQIKFEINEGLYNNGFIIDILSF